MKVVIQRVRKAEVRVEETVVGSIGYGALILVGVARGDTMEDAEYLARKAARLRIYEDGDGKLNAPIDDIEGGAFLAVSQFTLYGDCGKGNRPSYGESAGAEEGRQGYEWFVAALRRFERPVETGRFQEHMVVSLENDGPVTILIESRGRGAT
jgi:D-tyrosyl-tRNA(Tyr) deacylase